MRRKNGAFVLFFALLGLSFSLTACSKEDAGNGENYYTWEPVTYSWEEAALYEAEDGELIGETRVSSNGETTYVENFAHADEDMVTISFTVEESGFYDLGFVSSSGGSYKSNYVYIDGEMAGYIETECKDYETSVVSYVYLEAGSHTATVITYWGYIKLDSLLVKKADELNPYRFDVEPTLVNENASDNAKRVFTYLCDIYGEQMLTGQMCNQGMYGFENTSIYRVTGEYPAVLGLDMIEYSPSRVENGSIGHSVEAAQAYWDNGGIITMCWHWNAPSKYITGEWYSAFYKESTNINLDKIMNGEDPEGYELLLSDIDAIATEMKPLAENDVPLLWRPLHEASGGWFWWGDCSAESYKKLYILLYDKMTNEYGLNNLIWVWNGQDPEWYPGDEYVDIIGIDIYPGKQVTSPQTNTFVELLSWTDSPKLITLSENGCVFDVDLAVRDQSMWLYWNTWEGEFVLKNNNFVGYAETYTTEEVLKKAYESEYTITRDELPDLKTYPLR